MTGFNEFLLEDYSAKLSEESFLKALRQHCNNSHKAAKTTGLFTCFKGVSDFLMIDPKDRMQRSMFMVDELIEQLPSWNHTPYRRKAIIGYTSLSTAREYGPKESKPYVMLPYDNGRLCLLNGVSFYAGCDSAEKKMAIKNLSNGSLRGWLSAVRRAAKASGAKVDASEPDTGKAFLKAAQALEQVKISDKDLQELKLDDDDKDAVAAFYNRAGTVLEFLSDVLDPDRNKIEKLLAIHHNMPPNREVWTNAPCLLISVEAYKRLHEDGKIK